jgi:hypothetical protein
MGFGEVIPPRSLPAGTTIRPPEASGAGGELKKDLAKTLNFATIVGDLDNLAPLGVAEVLSLKGRIVGGLGRFSMLRFPTLSFFHSDKVYKMSFPTQSINYIKKIKIYAGCTMLSQSFAIFVKLQSIFYSNCLLIKK